MTAADGTDAVVLRLVDHGERARIITLYTPDSGRTAVMARGARGSSRRFGALDLFQRGVAYLTQPRRPGGMATLKSFEPTRTYRGIREDVVRFAAASFFTELVCVTTAAGEAAPKQHEVLVETLHHLDSANYFFDLILGFQLRWFSAMGELPALEDMALLQSGLPHLDDGELAVARALLAGVSIPELDAGRFRAVGALTRAVRNRVATRPLESTRFLHQVLMP